MSKVGFFLAFALTATPALASTGAPVPEGSAVTLLALGLVGVIVGRRGSMRRKDRDKD
jgi:hypothetical protein